VVDWLIYWFILALLTAGPYSCVRDNCWIAEWQRCDEIDQLMFCLSVVVQARNLPGMSTSDVSCPFVSVELCPLTMFPVTLPHRTPVRTSTVNPVYNEKFEL